MKEIKQEDIRQEICAGATDTILFVQAENYVKYFLLGPSKLPQQEILSRQADETESLMYGTDHQISVAWVNVFQNFSS